MKEKKTKEKKTITTDEVIENYKLLRAWHISSGVVSVCLICLMAAAVIWGIIYPELRLILISAGIAMGICGAGLYAVVHRTYIKTSAAVLDYFKVVSKMSQAEIQEKARELKIPEKTIKTK